eukprot:GAHX01000871.1.p1 GENE.GAHX01000871.1~~GAHX01000871.1.p1  ORF type:complete len:319 (-),score=32.13 GAHX01000871.1:506-1462(-)
MLTNQAFPTYDSITDAPFEKHEGQERERVNKYFGILPIIIFSFNLTFAIITLVHYKQTIGSPFTSPLKSFYYLILFAPFTFILAFPLYLFVWKLLRHTILYVFITIAFLPPVLFTALGLWQGVRSLIYGGLTSLVLEGIYFWWLWADIKIAVLSIKTAIEQLNTNLKRFTKHFTIPLAIFLFSLSLTAFSFMASMEFTSAKTPMWFETSAFKLWRVFLYLSLLCWVYTSELMAAVAYIYGAAIFDQTSLSKQVSPDNLNYNTVFDKAFSIAFKSSFGAACLGAMIITIIRILVGKSDQKKNRSLMGLLLYALLSLRSF